MMSESLSHPLSRLTYSLAEAEVATSLSRTGLYRLMARGELRTVQIGGRRLVPAAELERLVATQGGALSANGN